MSPHERLRASPRKLVLRTLGLLWRLSQTLVRYGPKQGRAQNIIARIPARISGAMVRVSRHHEYEAFAAAGIILWKRSASGDRFTRLLDGCWVVKRSPQGRWHYRPDQADSVAGEYNLPSCRHAFATEKQARRRATKELLALARRSGL